MPYVERVTKAGKTIEVDRYYTSRYRKKGIKRGDKVRPTKEAQKKAMRVVGDAWESDRQIDEDLQERRDLISTLHQENQQAQSRINEINQRQEALKEEYGITEDSQEQKDLELLRREKQMLTNPESGERLSMDELKYVWKLKEEGLTDYQQKQLSLDGEKSHFQSIIKNQKQSCNNQYFGQLHHNQDTKYIA